MAHSRMIYKDLTFPQLKNRPYFITDFVATIDGKVKVHKNGYWPIGSKLDFETFTYLRAHADVIIDGKNSALAFGKATIETIHSEQFKSFRKQIGKKGVPKYFVLTKSSNKQLERALKNKYGFNPVIFSGSIEELVQKLNGENIKLAFVDGGPTLLGSLLNKNILDEIFLTIAPKIFGNDGSSITMVEGTLFQPEKIKNLELLSVQTFNNEIFVRYKVLK